MVVETMKKEHLSIYAAMQEFGINDHKIIERWERIYLEEGPEGPQARKTLALQGLQAEKENKNANVRNAGWLHSFDADYHYRGSDLHYHVNVSAALSEGWAVW